MNDALLRNAYALHQAGDFAAAARLYGEVLRANPTNFNALCMLGQLHSQRGERDQANSLIDDALKVGSKSSRDFYNLGCVLQSLARHEDALKMFEGALAIRSDYFEALIHRGLTQMELQRFEDALASFERALFLRPNEAGVWHNRANAYLFLERFDEALKSYDRALSLKPDYAEAWENRGRALTQLSRHHEALASYERGAELKPLQASGWNLIGVTLIELKRYEEALATFDKVLAIDPRNFDALFQRANALLFLKRFDDALAVLDLCVEMRPDHVDSLVSRGAAFSGLERTAEALSCFEQALSLKSDCVEALVNRGTELIKFKRYMEALNSLDKALMIEPGLAEAYFRRGHALTWLRRFEDAVASFEQCLSIKPDHFDALVSVSFSLMALGRLDQALAACNEALAMKPDSLEALSNRGGILILLKRAEEAILDYEVMLRHDPEYPYALGNLLQCRLHCCDWRNLEQERASIREALKQGKRVVSAFQYVTSCNSAKEQLDATRLWVSTNCPVEEPLWTGERYRHDRIRIAYVSEDMRTHAVSSLLAGVWEAHDRARFETFAMSFGVDDKTEMRARVERSFEHFFDVRLKSDGEIASLLNEHEIDIAVDLMGYSGNFRPRIFALRPTPIQVGYLGYPATMGADFIDYILADSILIPEAMRECYHEKVVYLPDTYMANDLKRRIGEKKPTRAEVGLPKDGFVFCCFNNPCKLSPEVFAIWMRLLKQIEGSVLWLSDPGAPTVRNLRREAEAAGLVADRIILAPFLPAQEDHLARLGLADVFLDTLPYNAHTTASDSLWTGVPVVTSAGNALAGRVAASLLHAIGHPELVAQSPADYEAIALRLAKEPGALAAAKEKLARNRNTYPLFDTERFTRHLEAAFVTMWERYQRGEGPAHFAVPPMMSAVLDS